MHWDSIYYYIIGEKYGRGGKRKKSGKGLYPGTSLLHTK